MITQLTKEQETQIPIVRDSWLNYVLSCKNSINKEKAKKGIEWLYSFCGKEKPIIIFMDSPFGCQVAANFFLNYFKEDNIGANIRANIRANIGANIGDNIRANIGANIGANIWDNIWANIGANIRANIRANIGANIGDNIRANIGANIGANIRANIWANIGANIWDNIRANIWANIRDNNFEYKETSYYGNIGDFGWVAYIDYFFQMKLINSERENEFKMFKELILSGVYDMIQFDGLCIVSDMPTALMTDSNGRLHDVFKPSVRFKDETSYHYIHGVAINAPLWEKLDKKLYDFEDFVKEPNEEIKSAILSFMEERWGSEYLFRFISDNLEEVDTYTDKKDKKYLEGTTGNMNIGVYTLFKGSVNNIHLAFVRCYCPSTDRMFFLCVSSENNNAKDAIASLYRVPKNLKGEIKYIQRQGERYSTVFTQKGNSLLKKMTKEEISDLVHINGDSYFSLLKYEY